MTSRNRVVDRNKRYADKVGRLTSPSGSSSVNHQTADDKSSRGRTMNRGRSLVDEDDSLAYSTQESFASSHPFGDNKKDLNTYMAKTGSGSLRDVKTGTVGGLSDLSPIVSVQESPSRNKDAQAERHQSDDSIMSPIVSVADSRSYKKNMSRSILSPMNLAARKIEEHSRSLSIGKRSTSSTGSNMGRGSQQRTPRAQDQRTPRAQDQYTPRVQDENSMPPDGNINNGRKRELSPLEIKNSAFEEASQTSKVNAFFDCGSSLTVIPDDPSVSETTITSYGRVTGGDMNGNESGQDNENQNSGRAMEDAGSTNVLYNDDGTSTIASSATQEQGGSVVRTITNPKSYTDESVETMSVGQSVSLGRSFSSGKKKRSNRKTSRKIHSFSGSEQTQEFMTENPHLYAIREDQATANSQGSSLPPPAGNSENEEGKMCLPPSEIPTKKVFRYPKLGLCIFVSVLVIATIISAVVVAKDKDPPATPNSAVSDPTVSTPIIPVTSTDEPTSMPSFSPSAVASSLPSLSPSSPPSVQPSSIPSFSPSIVPTAVPTNDHSTAPSVSSMPSSMPSAIPSASPSGSPTSVPTLSQVPSAMPSISKAPTLTPSSFPSSKPSLSPRTQIITSRITSALKISDSNMSEQQRTALSWILYDDEGQIDEADNSLIERYALYIIHESLNGSNWDNNGSWTSKKNACDWNFVTCSQESVFSLSLDDNNMSGSIPSEISLLSNLETISLSGNAITGEIPSEIGQLSSLKFLSLSENKLTGKIPEVIFDLALESLDLSENEMSGSLDEGLQKMTSLEILKLSSNKFSGPIPPEFGALTKLEQLHLSNNLNNGKIPTEIGFLSNLKDLRLKENSLVGEIPSEIGKLTLLETFFLYQNAIVGDIPQELYNLSNLGDLRLFGNRLTGTISTHIGKLNKLAKLAWHGNKLAGTIPSEIGRLSNLNLLYLFDNSLTGNIPEEIGNLKFLQKMSLSINTLDGTLPESFENLTDLRYLSLWKNLLTGTIPSKLGNLGILTDLYIDGNSFHGTMPSSVCDLTNNALQKLFADCKDEIECSCCTACF